MGHLTDKKRYLTLDEREEGIQEVLGRNHRAILSDLLNDRVQAHVPPEGKKRHLAVMLSGGIDSNSIIASLIHDCGVMPDSTWTVTVPNENGKPVMGTDIRRAIKVSKHYGIKHHLLTLPESPEDTVRNMIEVATTKYPGMEPMSTLPDFEITPMLNTCIREMGRIGVTLMFSGVRDGGIHLVSGRHSRPNKKPDTAYTHYRVNAEFLFENAAFGSQTDYMTHLAHSEFGMEVCFPHAIVASQYPYFDTPWRIINRPREKWVSARAYREELLASMGTENPYMNAMQCGDSGIKDYYKRAFDNGGAEVASDWAGRKVSSPLQFVNDLRKVASRNNTPDYDDHGFDYLPDVGVDEEGVKDFKQASEDRELSDHMVATYGGFKSRTDWIAYISSGGKTKRPVGKVDLDEDGRSTLDYIPDDEEGEWFSDAFGTDDPQDREPMYLNEEGFIDDRVDCTGQPFHRGSSFSQVYCERAAAGLCGKKPESFEDQPDLHKCTLFDTRAADVGDLVNKEQIKTLPHLSGSNSSWAKSSMEVARLIKTGFSACIREEENTFPKIGP